MPWYEGSHRELIAAPPERCFAALTDYERMPEWQRALDRCEVIERDADGLASLVEYEIATPVKKVSYRLRHTYERPGLVSGELVEGQVKGFAGEWRFQERDGATDAEFSLRIDPGRWIPKKIASTLHETVLKRAAADLKAEAERSPATASKST